MSAPGVHESARELEVLGQDAHVLAIARLLNGAGQKLEVLLIVVRLEKALKHFISITSATFIRRL